MYARPTANTAWPLSISHRIVRGRLLRATASIEESMRSDRETGEERDSDRGDPRGLNESALAARSPLVPYSVSFRFSFPSVDSNPLVLFPPSVPSTVSPRDTRTSTRSSAITTFIRQVFRTTTNRIDDRKRNDVKLGRSKGSRGLSRSGRTVSHGGKGRGRVYFNGRGEPHAKVDAGQVEERGKRSCL